MGVFIHGHVEVRRDEVWQHAGSVEIRNRDNLVKVLTGADHETMTFHEPVRDDNHLTIGDFDRLGRFGKPKLRGLPQDTSEETRVGIYSDYLTYKLDAPHWLTGTEIEAFPWEAAMFGGMMFEHDYRKWMDAGGNGPPHTYSAQISKAGAARVTCAQMNAIMRGDAVREERPHIVIDACWRNACLRDAGELLDALRAPRASADALRFVFWLSI